jgi:hypothetical protein
MALRPPRDLRLESGASILDYELVAEKAATLGRLGGKAAKAVERLLAYDAGDVGDDERQVLLQRASDAVWCYFVQRELCGFRDHRGVIAELRIPPEVLKRLGAAPKR